MIKQILDISGCKSQEEFYKKYPTERSFMEAFPQARPLMEKYKNGGSIGDAFPQAPTADRFFNYGSKAMNIPRLMQTGGENATEQAVPIMQIISAVSEYNQVEPQDVVQSLKDNVPNDELDNLTKAASSEPEEVAKILNAYVQNTMLGGQENSESQYLEGQPYMQMLQQQREAAQEASQEEGQMPVDPNQAVQMAYGGGYKLHRFIPKAQPGKEVKKQPAPAANKPAPAPAVEEDPWYEGPWVDALQAIGTGGAGIASMAIMKKILESKSTIDWVTKKLGQTEEWWRSLSATQKMKELTKGYGKKHWKKGVGFLVTGGLTYLADTFDWFQSDPQSVPAPARPAQKQPTAPLNTAPADTSGLPPDSSDAYRVQEIQQYGGVPSSNYGQFTVPMQKGGQSAPMNIKTNDDVVGNRMSVLKKYVDNNVDEAKFQEQIKMDLEDMHNIAMQGKQLITMGKQMQPRMPYMKKGGALKKKVLMQHGGSSRAAYYPHADRIFISQEDMEADPSILEHELFHRYQNIGLDSLRIPEYYPGPLRTPQTPSADDLIYDYYNRRGIDTDLMAEEFFSNPVNDSFRFVPGQLMNDYQYDPMMYETPWTAEGEAEAYQQAVKRGEAEPLPDEYRYKLGGRKRKPMKDQRLKMALEGRLDYMQPGGSKTGFLNPFKRRSYDPYPHSSVRPAEEPQSPIMQLMPKGSFLQTIQDNMAQDKKKPEGWHPPMSPDYDPSLEKDYSCGEGYKWDPEQGRCVVAKTRAGRVIEGIGNTWQDMSGHERANLALAAGNSVVGMKERLNQDKQQEQLERNLFERNVFSATAPTDKGMHMVNQRTPVPPTQMTPVQFTGKNYTQDYYYGKKGGEMYLSDSDIEQIISLGGQVEFLD